MKFKMLKINNGFVALISVALVSAGILIYSLATLTAAADFYDQTFRREMRIQASLNAKACLEKLELTAEKDWFLSGQIEVPEFSCTGNVGNDFSGQVQISATSTAGPVSANLKRDLTF